MKLGGCETTEIMKRSRELAIPFADLLWGYAVEDMMLRIEQSEYREFLWLESYPILGEQVYRERAERKIHFFYQESGKSMPPEKLCPGQTLSQALAEQMKTEIFSSTNPQEIDWTGTVSEQKGWIYLNMTAEYCDMRVPLTIALHSYHADNRNSVQREEALTAIAGEKVSYLLYAPESRIGRDVFTIMEKLELVGDMSCYYNTYRMLHSQSLNGRYVIEELERLTENLPKIKTKERLAQIEGYRNYAYMRKRWEKYLRNHGQQPVPWEDALDLILEFLRPIWHSLCEQLVFFDDWMPELGRFLG